MKPVSERGNNKLNDPSRSSRQRAGGATSRPVAISTTTGNSGGAGSTFFVTVTTISNISGATSPGYPVSSSTEVAGSTATEKSTSKVTERVGKERSRSGGSKLTSSVSTLSFPIQTYSPLTIKCTGQLYDVYNETSSIQIQPKAPLHYPYPTLSTPKSQHKYGLPDQLQTYNSSGMPNGKNISSLFPPLPSFL